MGRRWITVLALTLGCARAAGAAGVVVAAVADRSAGSRAGLAPGDRLVAWERGPESGALATPIDWITVEAEQGPRGPVTVRFDRAGATGRAILPFDDWGVTVRPGVADPDEAALAAAEASAARGDDASAAGAYRGLAATAPPETRAWLWLRAAALAGRAGLWDDAQASFDEAVVLLDPRAQAAAVLPWAALQNAHGLRRQARQALQRALGALEPDAPESVALASVLAASGADGANATLADDEARLTRAVAILERQAPASLALAGAQSALGWLRAERGALQEGVERLHAASTAAEAVGPESTVLARCLRLEGFAVMASGNRERGLSIIERALPVLGDSPRDPVEHSLVLGALGSAANLRGDWREGERLFQRALALREAVAPDPVAMGRLVSGLGVSFRLRGDLAGAEAAYLRALEMVERGEGDVYPLLINLGNVAWLRKDFAAAESFQQRAVALIERTNPGSADLAVPLRALGATLRERGDMARAEASLRRALTIKEAQAPGQIGVVDYLQELARVARAQGREEEAAALLERALALARANAPGGMAEATTLVLQAGAPDGTPGAEQAETRLRAALAIWLDLAPGTTGEAEARHALGRVLRRQGRLQEALEEMRGAAAALDEQGRRVGGSREAAASFRSHFRDYSRDLEDLLLQLGREEDAFAAAEASRARALLGLLRMRDLDLWRDAPAGLADERAAADREHDRILARLGRERQPDERAALRRELAAVRQRQDAVRARLRAAAPRRGALGDPAPLDLAGARAVLEPGTLALHYGVAADSARVYAIGPEPGEFSVHEIAGAATLRARVAAFVDTIRARRGRLGRSDLDRQASALGRALLGPVAARLRRARRVLVVPDGPLHVLPFAALRMPDGTPLVRRVPVSVSASLTVYAQLRRADAPGALAGSVVGFGDPRYARRPAPRNGPVRRSGLEGQDLPPLPGARAELEALRELDPRSLLYAGAEATEERARALPPRVRVAHFACHAFTDDEFPLESGLALSAPARAGDANGYLQAWEILEDLRIDADLVTLSACESGLGKELPGEGLLGLTWAFQYAGAHSLLASLWEVDDSSTSLLMRRFYRHLASGAAKDEALWRAQVELLQGGATSAPYHWAAFVLIGDRR